MLFRSEIINEIHTRKPTFANFIYCVRRYAAVLVTEWDDARRCRRKTIVFFWSEDDCQETSRMRQKKRRSPLLSSSDECKWYTESITLTKWLGPSQAVACCYSATTTMCQQCVSQSSQLAAIAIVRTWKFQAETASESEFKTGHFSRSWNQIAVQWDRCSEIGLLKRRWMCRHSLKFHSKTVSKRKAYKLWPAINRIPVYSIQCIVWSLSARERTAIFNNTFYRSLSNDSFSWTCNLIRPACHSFSLAG